MRVPGHRNLHMAISSYIHQACMHHVWQHLPHSIVPVHHMCRGPSGSIIQDCGTFVSHALFATTACLHACLACSLCTRLIHTVHQHGIAWTFERLIHKVRKVRSTHVLSHGLTARSLIPASRQSFHQETGGT